MGWYQTRLRGKDTRPTYVPNSVFVDTMVTNMDRITHRRFETTFYLRFQVSGRRRFNGCVGLRSGSHFPSCVCVVVRTWRRCP